MGFWDNMDEPCLEIHWRDDECKETKELREENRKLKMMVTKLLEQGIHEQKRKEIYFDE